MRQTALRSNRDSAKRLNEVRSMADSGSERDDVSPQRSGHVRMDGAEARAPWGLAEAQFLGELPKHNTVVVTPTVRVSGVGRGGFWLNHDDASGIRRHDAVRFR